MITGLSAVEVAYLKDLKNYNSHVLKGLQRPNLFKAFSNLAKTFNDKQIEDMWSMVEHMVDMPSMPMGAHTHPRCTLAAEQAIVKYARKYMENRYKQFMNSIVGENLALAERGGVPGIAVFVFVAHKICEIDKLTNILVNFFYF